MVTRTVQLFVTCLVDGFYPEVGEATVEVGGQSVGREIVGRLKCHHPRHELQFLVGERLPVETGEP